LPYTDGFRYTRGLHSCELPRLTKTYHNRHFDVKLMPELFHAKLIIGITILDKPGGKVQSRQQTLKFGRG
jgi:hypothetical protein